MIFYCFAQFRPFPNIPVSCPSYDNLISLIFRFVFLTQCYFPEIFLQFPCHFLDKSLPVSQQCCHFLHTSLHHSLTCLLWYALQVRKDSECETTDCQGQWHRQYSHSGFQWHQVGCQGSSCQELYRRGYPENWLLGRLYGHSGSCQHACGRQQHSPECRVYQYHPSIV